MEKEEVQQLYNEFLASNRILKKYGGPDEYFAQWKSQSSDFKNFWQEKMVNDPSRLSYGEIDEVVAMLDGRGKGAGEAKKQGMLAVAWCGINQDLWRKMFLSIAEHHEVAILLKEIFNSASTEQINLINHLYKINANYRNGLTSEGAVCLNAMLCLNDPENVLSSVNMETHRFRIIDYLGIEDSRDWATPGERIVDSNDVIINGFKEKFGLDIPAVLLSLFYYEYQEELGLSFDAGPKEETKRTRRNRADKEINIF